MIAQNTWIISALALVACLASSSTTLATSVNGQATVNDFLGSDALTIKFATTDSENLLVIESNLTALNNAINGSNTNATNGSNGTYVFETAPYKKFSGVIDCVNVDSGTNDVLILSGSMRGIAEDIWYPGSATKFFQVGDRFLTAIKANSVGTGDKIGEISNLGQDSGASASGQDCMHFTADEFDLRHVSSGHFSA